MDDLHEPVQAVFRELFDDDEMVLSDEMTARDVRGWDSLMHINIIVAVEKRFGVRFANAEISDLKSEGKNVGNLFEARRNKLAGQ